MNEVELKQYNMGIIKQSQELVIFRAEDNSHADMLLKIVMKAKKCVKDFWKEPKEKAYQAHRAISGKETMMLEPIVKAERRIKGKISIYLTYQEEERRSKEKKLREETERKEKARLAEIAKKEKELKDAEGYLSPEQIAKEQAKIDKESQKEFVPEVKIEKEKTPTGQITKEYWSAEVIEGQFHLLPDTFKLPNMQMLNTLARTEKEKAEVPGVKFNKRLGVETR